MAKYNISFNDVNYSIDEASLSAASDALKSHFSTVMNGSGATISLDGANYNIDSAKLATETNAFVTHLGTVAGNGYKVKVGGVEYGVDSAKMTGAVAEIEAVLAGLNNPDVPSTGDEILEGDGQEFHKFAPAALTFRSTAPLNELQEVQINGVTVDPSNYTLEEGSTIVTLPIEYLKTLDVDNYEITVVSDSKTAKGGFTVVQPELNEHGFYYNQPYTAWVDYLGGNHAIILREDGTMDILTVAIGNTETGNYTVSGNNLTLTCSLGTLTGVVSSDGTELYNNEFAANFVLGDESIAADEDYFYIYKEDLGGYEVTAIDKTKAEYGAIKTGINGIDTVKLTDSMFYNCDSLASVAIPNTVESIGMMAFYNCSSITSIAIPSGVTSIGSQAFCGCDSLASVVIPDGMTSIDNAVFRHCGSLMSVTIPDSVTNIGSFAFGGCTSLANITIPDSVTNIGSRAFDGCTSLTNITIHNGVTSINEGVFNGCTNLVSVAIPDSVTSIGNFAFSGCSSLTNIEIPDSVTSIGREVFHKCTILNDIAFKGTIAQWNAITKGDHISDNWSGTVPATYVQCSDGQVAL